jgi:cytochrome c biogenesis protein CcdA
VHFETAHGTPCISRQRTVPRAFRDSARYPVHFGTFARPRTARKAEMKRAWAFVFLLSAAALFGAEKPALAFAPPQWKFGMVAQGAKVEQAVVVRNPGSLPVTVTFVPTCTCLISEPSSQVLPARAEGTFLLSYDSSDDTGLTRKDFIVRTDPPGPGMLVYTLTGTVRAERNPTGVTGSAWIRRGGPAGGADAVTAVLSYYYTPGCRSCEEFLSVEIPKLQKELGIRIVMEKKDILRTASYEELSSLASARGGTIRELPALLAGETLLQGDREIRENLAAALRAGAGSSPAAPRAAAAPGVTAGLAADRLAIVPVLLAGLADGINPCAFTTLIFLLASLALAGRGRREVLLIGAVFSAAVFLTYLGIGLGFFAALRAAGAAPLVSLILRWALVLALAVFAGLSIYDYTLIRAGRPGEMLLQLPTVLKRRIHSSIRGAVRTSALVGSSLVLGFLVSIFEFACTGQVYLPTLGVLARMHRQADALALLALYNLCFITPLLAVFGASYLGVSSGRITTFFQAHMGAVKLVLAAVFIGLAVLTLVG